eukprot:COSAG02_NODE_24477_length_687_cov_0.775510_1_plen_117_part_10
MSTKGVAIISGDSRVCVFGNGKGDFLEEVVPKTGQDLHRNGRNHHPLGHIRSDSDDVSKTGSLPGPKMDRRTIGKIRGVDVALVSNELTGKVAPLTLDSRDDRSCDSFSCRPPTAGS